MRVFILVLALAATPAEAIMLRCDDVETVIGYPPEPKAQCFKTWVLMSMPESDGCTADLGDMARESAETYARLRTGAEEYAGLFDGLVLKPLGPSGAGAACVTTCVKLPKGGALVELRGIVSGGGRNAHPGRKTFSTGVFDAEAGKPYLMQHEAAETPIGPVVCARVGNARPQEDKWGFGLYVYYGMTSK